MKDIFTAEIHTAFLAALAALEEKNTAGFFKQLEILYHLHSSDQKYKEISLAEFLDQLRGAHKKEISALSDSAIAHYQAINATLRGFPIIGATVTGIILQEERGQQSKTYLNRYIFLAPGVDPEHAISTESAAFFGIQQNIYRVTVAGKIACLLLPNLLHKETITQEKQPDDREITALAMTAFSAIHASEIRLQKLHELAENYWRDCIAALNSNDIHSFYSSLANLAKTLVHQIIASNKNPSGDKIKSAFQALHEKMKLNSENFTSPLTERGLEIYKTLFKEHCRSFGEITRTQPSDNIEDETERQKKASANYFFFLLLPAPDNFLGDIPNSTEIQSAINVEFDSREFRQQYVQQLEAQERRIQAAKYACLLALKDIVSNDDWKLEGKTLIGFLFPLLSRCCPSLGHKTPAGVKKLAKILEKTPVRDNADAEYAKVKTLLFSKAKSKMGRSENTEKFYALWRENLNAAEAAGVVPPSIAAQ